LRKQQKFIEAVACGIPYRAAEIFSDNISKSFLCVFDKGYTSMIHSVKGYRLG